MSGLHAYSFTRSAESTELDCITYGGARKRFALEVPDYDGAQTDRLPLPAHLETEQTVLAVFRQAALTDTRFAFFPVSVASHGIAGKYAVWVKRL